MATVQAIVLFDGDCAYCNGWVRWISKRDKRKRFRFVAIESEEGKALRAQHRVPADLESMVLIRNGGAHVKSSAAWRIFTELPGWGWAGALLAVVPKPLRNWGYDLIARNRHRLGMKDSCELPPR
jgi:predicted DCC family thiol-disulfide oxidoreductase YuxK